MLLLGTNCHRGFSHEDIFRDLTDFYKISFFFLFPLHSFQWYNVVEETHSQLLTALDNQAQFQSWMSFTGQEFYSP